MTGAYAFAVMPLKCLMTRGYLKPMPQTLPLSDVVTRANFAPNPKYIVKTLDVVASLRGISLEAARQTSTKNALEAFPRLRACVA